MEAVAIIQARMTSTRLPGKVLMPAAGKPMLEHEIDRVRRARRIDRIVVATTTNAADDPVAALALRLGVGVHRGSEHDVLTRMADAAAADGAGLVVRLTADCPLLDPAVLDRLVERLLSAEPPAQYATNSLPRTWPLGLDAEAMRAEALFAAAREATDPYDREHVTPFLYRHPDRFRLVNLPSPVDLSRHRWTLDTPADYELLRRILEALLPVRPTFGYQDVLALLEAHPDWPAINAAVPQKQRRYEADAAAAIRDDQAGCA